MIREGFAVSGMTQSQLARATGLPRSTLANILSPTAKLRLIHVEQLIKIAVATGVDARVWARELEAVERRLNPNAGRRRSPQVQRRAARTPPAKGSS